MRWIVEVLLSAIVIFLIVYFVIYKYFLDGFCYIRNDDYLKCTNTFICKPERAMLSDPTLLCSKKDFFLFERDSAFYNKETYIKIYNSYTESVRN